MTRPSSNWTPANCSLFHRINSDWNFGYSHNVDDDATHASDTEKNNKKKPTTTPANSQNSTVKSETKQQHPISKGWPKNKTCHDSDTGARRDKETNTRQIDNLAPTQSIYCIDTFLANSHRPESIYFFSLPFFFLFFLLKIVCLHLNCKFTTKERVTHKIDGVGLFDLGGLCLYLTTMIFYE